MIADLVGSRRYGSERGRLQDDLRKALQGVNRRYSRAVLAKFVITAGDEFQGLLQDARVIPDILWDLDVNLKGVAWPFGTQGWLRMGIGCGTLETELNEYAMGMDGSAWHLARQAVNEARASRGLGIVFRGFGQIEVVIGALARLLQHLRKKFRGRQMEVLDQLRKDPVQIHVGRHLGISKQAVSKKARSAGWEAYREGELALRTLLELFDFTGQWSRP